MEFIDRAAGIVRHPQQEGDDHPVRDQGRAALGEERRSQTGERDEAGDPADDDEDLEGDRERQSCGEQRAEAVAQLLRGPDAAFEDEEVAEQDDEETGHAELLAEARVDEVGFRVGDHVRSALAESGADETAVGHSEQALDELVGPARRLVVLLGRERIQPTVDALLDVGEEQCREDGAGGEEGHADDDPRDLRGRDVEHGDEEAEEEERGAEVAFEDEDADAGDPRDDDGAEVAQPREADAEDLRAREHELIAVGDEVAGEEDREEDLRDLTGLERQRSDADPDAGAVDRPAEARDEGQQEEEEGEEARDVGVAAQPAVVAEDDEHGDREPHAERHPDELLGGAVEELHATEVDAVDHRQAESVEEDGDGHEDGVGVLRLPPHDDVDEEGESRQPRHIAVDVGRHGIIDAEPDERVGTRRGDDRQDDEPELGQAVGPGPGCLGDGV